MGEFRTTGQLDESFGESWDTVFNGVNNRLAPDKLPPGMLADLVNGRMREGEPETRKGVVKPGWLNVTRAGVDNRIGPMASAYGLGVFKDPNDSRQWVLVFGEGTSWRCQASNGRFELAKPTGVKFLGPVVAVQAFDKVYAFRGKDLQPLVLSDLDTGWLDLLPRWSSTSSTALTTEVAYGPFQSVSTLTSGGNTATVVTAVAHGYVSGADVIVSGATQTEYNGRWNITVTDEVTFTYVFPGSATTPATGTITVSNMAQYWKATTGTSWTLTSITRVGTTATATKNGHGFSNGQSVTIAGASDALYNGTYTIGNVTANTFDYTMAGVPAASPAVGTLTALNNSVIIAGQSPDSNASLWTRLYNVLPNADDAIYVNNRLLVPTAYSPGGSSYGTASFYGKKDFIVATDILDEVHFDFSDEFRINEGSDDEIVALVKYNQDTAIVYKERSWGVLTGISLDLSNLSLDMRGDGYGACSRVVVVAGRDAFAPSLKRGLCSLQQNELGQVRSVDTPYSNDVAGTLERVNWNLAGKQRVAWWNDCLYWAVALDDGRCLSGDNLVLTASYDYHGTVLVTIGGFKIGMSYLFVPGNSTSLSTAWSRDEGIQTPYLPAGTVIAPGKFTAAQETYYAIIPNPDERGDVLSTADIEEVFENCNNAVLVYDFRLDRAGDPFRTGQWSGYDTGPGLCVQEFAKANWQGLERLFFLGADGFVNLVEEASAGDQGADGGSGTGLAFREIAYTARTRGHDLGQAGPKQYKRLDCVLGVWAATVSVAAGLGQAHTETSVRSGLTFSRTKYLQPAGRADYVEGNGNGDWATPGRGDYSVRLVSGGTGLDEGGGGLRAGQYQEVRVRASTRGKQGRYLQLVITNATGRLRVKGIGPSADEGLRRDGVLLV